DVAPWLALGAASVPAGGVTALGRAGFGSKHGIDSRHITLATPLWVADPTLLPALARGAPADGPPPLPRGAAAVLAAAARGVGVAVYSCERQGGELRRECLRFQAGRGVLVGRSTDLAGLQKIYTPDLGDRRTGLPTPAFGRLWHRIEFVRAERLSVFHP